MVNGVKIANQPHRAADRPQQQPWRVFQFCPQAGAFLPEDCASKGDGNQVAEEAFLQGGQITGQAHHSAHSGKAESGGDNQQNALSLWAEPAEAL